MKRINESYNSNDVITLDLYTLNATISAYPEGEDVFGNPEYEEEYTFNIGLKDIEVFENDIKMAIARKLKVSYEQFDAIYFSKRLSAIMVNVYLSSKEVANLTNKFAEYDDSYTFFLRGSIEAYENVHRHVTMETIGFSDIEIINN